MECSTPASLSECRDQRPVGLQIRGVVDGDKTLQFLRWNRERLQMVKREGTSYGSDERRVQEKVAATVSVIWAARAPASACLEMLENAVIGAAASVHALKETKSTRATMQYSTKTLKMIKKKKTDAAP